MDFIRLPPTQNLVAFGTFEYDVSDGLVFPRARAPAHPLCHRHEGPLADLVEAWALAHYPREQVRRVSHSLVVGALDDPRPAIALVGHLDTVPGHDGDGACRAWKATGCSAWAPPT